MSKLFCSLTANLVLKTTQQIWYKYLLFLLAYASLLLKIHNLRKKITIESYSQNKPKSHPVLLQVRRYHFKFYTKLSYPQFLIKEKCNNSPYPHPEKCCEGHGMDILGNVQNLQIIRTTVHHQSVLFLDWQLYTIVCETQIENKNIICALNRYFRKLYFCD